MAIARDNFSTSSTTGTSLTISHTTTGSNLLMLVGVYEDVATGTTPNTTGITYNGVALTQLVSEYRTFSAGLISSIWGLVAPATGTHNVVISEGSSIPFNGFVATYTGCAQSLPTGTALKQFSSNSATDATMNPVTTADGSWAFSVYRNIDGSISDNTNYTSLVAASSIEAGDSNGSTGAAGTITVTATRATNTRWGGCVTAAFAPVAAAANNGNFFAFF